MCTNGCCVLQEADAEQRASAALDDAALDSCSRDLIADQEQVTP